MKKIKDILPKFIYKSGHINTTLPTLFRKVEGVNYKRERINTPDNDFLDLDWSTGFSDNLAIISHGLEGNSNRAYVKGMVKVLNREGIDCLAWNFRTCGGEMNQQPRMYHSGATCDLKTVINHVVSTSKYKKIILVGFSMGGNLSLMYLGEEGKNVPKEIVGSIVFSVPCDLTDSSKELAKLSCKLYMKRFLIKLGKKIKIKEEMFPNEISSKNYSKIKTFKQFDDIYTAKIHGFKNAEDYWEKCSSKRVLNKISRKTYIINAKDDPFLGDKCYPFEEVEKNEYLNLITPKYGGHVGFVEKCMNETLWSEKVAVKLASKILI